MDGRVAAAMDVAKLFDDWAARGRAEGMEAGHGKTAGPLIASLPITDGTHFLDLGCGNGWAARFAASRGAKSVGIDASAAMVDRAIAAAVAEGLDTTPDAPTGAEFHVGDFAALPFDDGTFNVVWSMEAVYYAPDPDAVLAEVARVTAPGAVFHMIIDFYGENTDSHSWPEDVGVPMSLRSEAEWIAAFEAAGFSDVQAARLKATADDAEAWKKTQGSLHVTGTR